MRKCKLGLLFCAVLLFFVGCPIIFQSKHTLTMLEPYGQGTVSPVVGAHQYAQGSSVTISASPNSDWLFVDWEVDGEFYSNKAVTSIKMDSDKNVRAIFLPPPPLLDYTLTMLEPDGEGTVVPEIGSHIYPEDTVLTLTAIPDEGWDFEVWEVNGAFYSNEAITTLIMDSDKSVKAYFLPPLPPPPPLEYSLTMLDPHGQGTVVPSVGDHFFTEGTKVMLTAIPDKDWDFEIWEVNGVFFSFDPEISLIMDSDKQAQAYFRQTAEVNYQELLDSAYFSGSLLSSDRLENQLKPNMIVMILTSGKHYGYMLIDRVGEELSFTYVIYEDETTFSVNEAVLETGQSLDLDEDGIDDISWNLVSADPSFIASSFRETQFADSRYLEFLSYEEGSCLYSFEEVYESGIINFKPSDGTIVASSENYVIYEDVEPTDEQVAFKLTKKLPRFHPGDIIIDHQTKRLRRVKEEPTYFSDHVVIITEEADLDEAFPELKLNFDLLLSETEGSDMQSASGFGGVQYNSTLSLLNTEEARATLSLDISYDPRVIAELDLGWTRIRHAKLGFDGEFNFSAVLEASFDGHYGTDGETPSFFSPSFSFFIGPVPVEIKVSVYAGYDIYSAAEGDALIGYWYSHRAEFGVVCTGGGFRARDWQVYSHSDTNSEIIGPEYSIQGSVEIRPYVKLDLAMFVCYVVGPIVGISPYVEAEAQASGSSGEDLEVDLSIDWGVVGDIAVKLKLWRWDTTLPDDRWELFDIRQNLWNASFGWPRHPEDLSVTEISARSLTLEWKDKSVIESGYEVWRKTTGNFTEIVDLPENTETYKDSGLTEGVEYTYKVRAYSKSSPSDGLRIPSAWSNEVSAIPREKIETTTLTVQVEGDGTVDPEEGIHTFDKDTLVHLRATPANEWIFDRWIGEVVDSASAETTVLMDKDKAVKALFIRTGCSVTRGKDGLGTGIRYGILKSCFADHGWAVPVPATAGNLITSTNYDYDSPYYFENHGFRHAGVDLVGPTTNPYTANTPVYAVGHGVIRHIVRGTVPRDMVIFIEHTADNGTKFLCVYGHAYASNHLSVASIVSRGEQVGTLRLAGDPMHLHFEVNSEVNPASWGWGAIRDGTQNPLQFLIDNPGSVSDHHSLIILIEGNGSTSPVEGVHQFMKDSAVSLKAFPDEDWEFDKWIGEVVDTSMAETTVLMDKDKTVTAVFKQKEDDQEVIFTDPNLEQVIREAIDKPTGPIYKSDVDHIEGLSAIEKGISDLSGIENLVSLELFVFKNNTVSDLSPLADLSSLEWLDFHGNLVSDLSPLSGLENLYSLNLSYNKVCDLSPIAALANLGELYLRGNLVEDLTPLEGLTNLSWLNFSMNSVVDLSPLTYLVNLGYVFASDNRISDLGPLVANQGIGSGDIVDIQNNDLDLTPGSKAMEDIQTLTDRGVIVFY